MAHIITHQRIGWSWVEFEWSEVLTLSLKMNLATIGLTIHYTLWVFVLYALFYSMATLYSSNWGSLYCYWSNTSSGQSSNASVWDNFVQCRLVHAFEEWSPLSGLYGWCEKFSVQASGILHILIRCAAPAGSGWKSTPFIFTISGHFCNLLFRVCSVSELPVSAGVLGLISKNFCNWLFSNSVNHEARLCGP